jgi:DNA-binding NtrC family response regulator
MKPASPTNQQSEQGTSARSFTVQEELSARPPASSEHVSALLAEINSLAETASIAETLELSARLLGELEIAVTSLSLDRGGFVTSWKSSEALVHEVDSSLSDASISARADAASLEVRYRGELNPLTKRAAGAILRAAVIQTERCSRRAWGFAPAEQVSAKARALEADIERVARLPYNILITGETGTGKTRSAREIHRRSARSTRPFMELNCANLPEQLVEAELFGYRKGAFTGADRDHRGLFEESDGGILFLDEIGDIPVAVQNKLLKAIDEKQIKRLGTNRYNTFDVQIIAATSRDLRGMIREGSFREDLYCRLAVLKFETAPLRERREDIPALIDLFLREAAATVSRLSGKKEEYPIETGAVELMCAAAWAGNIRVLRNTIYELTSFVAEGRPITMERVQTALTRLNAREPRGSVSNTSRDGGVVPATFTDQDSSTMEEVADILRQFAQEGDIVLPVEVCILRRGETLRQWAARVKQLGIEATCRTNGAGTLREAASRLGVSHGSIKGHLYRARCSS